jgi:hypothetical protein
VLPAWHAQGPGFNSQHPSLPSPCQKGSQMLVTHVCNLSYLGSEIGRIVVQAQCAQIVCEIPISKITRAKWAGGVAQVVEHLLCKDKALSSNPIPTKKKSGGGGMDHKYKILPGC